MTTCKEEVRSIFLFSIIFCTTTSTVIHFEREWNVTSSDLIGEDETLGKDNIAAYAKCNDISKTERECILVYEFLHPMGFIFKNKCYASFRHNKGIENLDMMKIRAASKGKIVMSYVSDQEKEVAKWATIYRVIDTSTCTYYESKVLFNITQLSEQLGNKYWEGNVFINDDETFDTFLAQKNLCDGARCRVTFGSDGKMIRDPVSYLPTESLPRDIQMFPLVKTSKYDEYFAVVKEQARPKLNSNQHNGPTGLKLLHEF
ncbi:uncharacterized protein LOC131673470 isoform X2 [Phymastichus coffea]|uniref:uncharacterized protein LOC131673470 isoform X2 n=1 Tax=Phymastichus coffea TaxID=108790 RepID=UPI00273CA18E|nr:uncharacterized protein LOC131673470 isoform X2 [Phymastichus coffea]